ncbi:MAG: hypothetical protein IJF83_07035 [Methanobrevibacter sp.]|nr:hypothetical protein [Methanobrevibacter sp.]
MTVIIALKDKKNKRIIFGSDRQYSQGIIKGVCKNKIITKKVNIIDAYYNELDTREIHIGLAGPGFIAEIIEYNFTAPDMNEKQTFMEYLYDEFLEELRQILIDKKLSGTSNEVFKSGSNILIVFDDEIYEIFSNFSVSKIPDEYAVAGAGFEIAIGSLYTNLHYHPDLDRVEVVRQALTTCGVNTIYCDTNLDIKTIDYI